MRIKKSLYSSPLAFVLNLVLAYIVYELCRFTFLFENWSALGHNLTWSALGEILQGGWMFDTSAILYTNALYALLMLLPIHLKESDRWQRVARWVFVAVNSLGVIVNLMDSVYFQYTGRRTTSTVFTEFGHESNLLGVMGAEVLRHWYLVLVAAVLIYLLWRCYVQPQGDKIAALRRPYFWQQVTCYYVVQTLSLGLFVPLCIAGMRGGFTTAVRPITISNANQYAESPQLAALVLNTPFSLIRTIGKNVFAVPSYFSAEELDTIYSPVHEASKQAPKRKNVVVLIVESFGREYIGGYNKDLDGGQYRGYTPFVDSLMQRSVTFEYSFCNGRKSIDGMPSILSSIPMFVEPFFLTPSSMNNVSGLAGELGREGYYSAFFHGAENGSMGFQAFARTSGFQDYFGRTEYDADTRFGGDKDFDGMWAIWDEPFLQFFATQMNDFREPFVSTVFTASSHHPYTIPTQYRQQFPEEGIEIHKCVRYTDLALRRFFETASRQPWYGNTLFVLTADHTNLSDHAEYQTDLGYFSVPLLFFDPSGELTPGMRPGIAQQIDILPTLLGYLGYSRPYIGFGKDLFDTPAADTWAVNYLNGIYQLVKGDYLLQWDGETTRAIYRFRSDTLLKDNLVGKIPVEEQTALEREVKAIIQSYMTRMTSNELVIK